MTEEDHEKPGTGEQDHEQPGEREASAAEAIQPGRVPAPEPEEVPELLGERSDYPIVWDGEDR